MSDPKWVTRQQAEMIHDVAIEIGGGREGIKDPNLLESALGRVQNQHAYGETDTFRLAAGYAEAISQNHAFEDGNKRTAFLVASDFLEQNGFKLQSQKQTEHEDMMVDLVKGKITREDAAQHLETHSRRERVEKPTRSLEEKRNDAQKLTSQRGQQQGQGRK